MIKKCTICERIERIKNNANLHFIKEFESGYAVLGDYQYFPGYSVFLSKAHVEDLEELSDNQKGLFFKEAAHLGTAIKKAFKPVRMNYELLGNSDPHLHWHIFPRYKNDGAHGKPIWVLSEKTRKALKPSREQIEMYKKKILKYV